MKTYKKVDVAEQQLEDVVRRYASMIEEGLVYVDHQRHTAEGRLDVLMVDSGKSFVVAELKIVQDDGMLLQALDYYDYVSDHIESYARLYKDFAIDPTQNVRLFLIAPSFSQISINRCKWLTPEISLFTVNCLKIDGVDEIIPIFSDQSISARPPVIAVTRIQDHLDYITDEAVRCQVSAFLEEIRGWKPDNISFDPVALGISMKVNGRVFAYLCPRRKHYIVPTYDTDGEWKDFPVRNEDDFVSARNLVKSAMERKLK
jgi:hypothetical protein